MAAALTLTEARIVYSTLQNSWVPMVGYPEFRSAMEKLQRMSGGTVCCRDCTQPGTIPSHLGGFTCEMHRRPRVEDDLA